MDRNTIDHDLLHKKIQEVLIILVKYYNLLEVTVEDLVNYFNTESPYGDTATLKDILKSKWLLIHEIVEISELKKMGHKISGALLYTHPVDVNKAHIPATEIEFKVANAFGDKEWIKLRIQDVKNWIDDPELTPDLVSRCNKLVEFYSN